VDWQAAADPLRTFLEEAEQLVAEPGGEAGLRDALTGQQPFVPLAYLAMKSPDVKARYLPEILAAVADGPHQSLLLARDVLRSVPRSVLENEVPAILPGVLGPAGEDSYRRVAEVVVELRLDASLTALRSMAADHPDAEVRECLVAFAGVEGDGSRWGRQVQEWPIREAG
jgi:hypothetical protein